MDAWGTPMLSHTMSVCPGRQPGSGYPLFKDPHLRDQHQHGPQHQPHRRLCLLGPQRRRRAERLRDPCEPPGTVQDQEPQRIMGGLGEQEYFLLAVRVVEVLRSLSHCLTQYISTCVSGESSVLRQSQPQRERVLQVSLVNLSINEVQDGVFTASCVSSGLQIWVTTLSQTRAERSTTSPTEWRVQRWRSTV